MTLAESDHHFDHAPPSEVKEKPNIACGIYLPKKILTNAEIESWKILTSGGNLLTAENIEKRTGIARRYVANEEETAFYMGLQAAEQALNGKQADAVIVSTSFPVGFNVSQRISDELGLQPNFKSDVHAACSGFTKSLAYLKQHESEFEGKKILLIATEKYSPHLYDLRNRDGINADPSLAQTLFSDGAIAMTFEYGKDLQILHATDQTFTDKENSLIKMPFDKDLRKRPFLDGNIPIPPTSGKLEQDGLNVYKLIIRSIPPLIRNTINAAHLDSSQIKMIVPHQGSGHMVEGIRERLEEYSIASDFADGNFSSASIPKALMKAVGFGEIKKGDNLVLAGFGAGMFASVAVIKLG